MGLAWISVAFLKMWTVGCWHFHPMIRVFFPRNMVPKLVAIYWFIVHFSVFRPAAIGGSGGHPGWRGGMRSGSMAWLFSLCGFQVVGNFYLKMVDLPSVKLTVCYGKMAFYSGFTH